MVVCQTGLKEKRPPASARGAPGAGSGWRGLFWLVFCLLACPVLLEVVLAAGRAGEQEFVKIDPAVGFVHLENKRVTFRSEGFSSEAINSHGFRDRERKLAKPAGTLRVAVLGDSKVEAFQVPLDQTFPSKLERKLRASGNGACEVLNFGMSGYSTGQEYLLFLNRVAAYKPDITILAFHIGDSDENCTADGALASLPRPYFSLDPAGRLAIDYSLLDQWLKGDRARIYAACDGLRRASRVWGVLANLEMTLAADKTYQWLASRLAGPAGALVGRLVSLLPPAAVPETTCRVLGPDPASVLPASLRAGGHERQSGAALPAAAIADAPPGNEAQVYLRAGLAKWRITRAIISELNQACRRAGSRLVVAALPAPNNSVVYFKEIRYLEELARSDGFAFIDVNRAFPSLAPMEKSPLYYNFHFSPAGHALVADTIFNALRSGRLIP